VESCGRPHIARLAVGEGDRVVGYLVELQRGRRILPCHGEFGGSRVHHDSGGEQRTELEPTTGFPMRCERNGVRRANRVQMSKPGNQANGVNPHRTLLRKLKESRHSVKRHSWRKYPHHDEGASTVASACTSEHETRNQEGWTAGLHQVKQIGRTNSEQ